MTEEEKKEFEEFLQWKKEKAEKEKSEKEGVISTPETSLVEDNKKAEPNEKPDLDNNVVSETSPEKGDTNWMPILFAVLAVVFIFIAVGTCSHKSQQPVQAEEVVEDSVAVVEIEPDPEPVAKTWDFSISKDDMTDNNNIWARIESDDYVSQEFPYEGFTYASITVRYMKKYGYDVLIQITKGQINGSSYNGTNYITARFDGGTPKKYYFDEAADGSPEMVFLRSKSDFISKCKKAKDIKIDLPLYKGGRPTFTFHVDEPLVWRTE